MQARESTEALSGGGAAAVARPHGVGSPSPTWGHTGTGRGSQAQVWKRAQEPGGALRASG